jgi:hypothetical protein
MKLVFTFSVANPSEGYTTTAIDIADEVLQLPDARDRVLALGRAVGELTRVNLAVTCLPLNIKAVRVKEAHIDQLPPKEQQEIAALLTEFAETIVAFNYTGRELAVRKLRIAAPIAAPIQNNERPRSPRRLVSANTKKSASFKDSLQRPDFNALGQYDAKQQAYYGYFAPVIENLLVLLNAHPTHNEWRFQGISPRWFDETQQKQAAKRHQAAQHKVTKEITRENRRKDLEDKRARHAARPKSDVRKDKPSDKDADED